MWVGPSEVHASACAVPPYPCQGDDARRHSKAHKQAGKSILAPLPALPGTYLVLPDSCPWKLWSPASLEMSLGSGSGCVSRAMWERPTLKSLSRSYMGVSAVSLQYRTRRELVHLCLARLSCDPRPPGQHLIGSIPRCTILQPSPWQPQHQPGRVSCCTLWPQASHPQHPHATCRSTASHGLLAQPSHPTWAAA